MSGLGSSVWRWVRRGMVVLGLSALMADGGLDQNEIECEEAVSFLQGCCPDWEGATVACVQNSGCGGSVGPALTIDQSECILSETCAQVQTSGLCDRVKNLASPTTDDFSDASTPPQEVCP